MMIIARPCGNMEDPIQTTSGNCMIVFEALISFCLLSVDSFHFAIDEFGSLNQFLCDYSVNKDR